MSNVFDFQSHQQKKNKVNLVIPNRFQYNGKNFFLVKSVQLNSKLFVSCLEVEAFNNRGTSKEPFHFVLIASGTQHKIEFRYADEKEKRMYLTFLN